MQSNQLSWHRKQVNGFEWILDLGQIGWTLDDSQWDSWGPRVRQPQFCALMRLHWKVFFESHFDGMIDKSPLSSHFENHPPNYHDHNHDHHHHHTHHSHCHHDQLTSCIIRLSMKNQDGGRTGKVWGLRLSHSPGRLVYDNLICFVISIITSHAD